MSILSTVLHYTTLPINNQGLAQNCIKMLSALFGSTNMENQFSKLSLLEVVNIQDDTPLLRIEETYTRSDKYCFLFDQILLISKYVCLRVGTCNISNIFFHFLYYILLPHFHSRIRL